ncbi:hypothetical protein H5V45_03410 [Nocardioides sp. KIGAM211]|uniref:Uncharacterized protein n=1 Tax=Nocardioides luti TaxID=2761101 RepID=A0A7X0RDL4_9ACTN|nr:hypothetical protein [Nocardioides luti]MBB6626362.1 hypothetical protein [Nocardioides luti]
MARQQPGSVTNAVRVLVALIALTVLTALLTVVLHDELVRSWAAGRADGGVDVQPPAFTPVAIVLCIVFAALAGVLIMFVRDGHGWARISLAALVVFIGIGSLAILRTDPPPVFLVISVVSVLLDLALLVLLWHRDSSAYMRGAWLSSHPDEAGLDSSTAP